MRVLLAFAFICACYSAPAQNFDTEMNAEERKAYDERMEKYLDESKKLGIKTSTSYEIKKGDSLPLWRYEYSLPGYHASSTEYKRGKEKEKWVFEHNEKGETTLTQLYKKERLKSSWQTIYPTEEKKQREDIWKKGEGKPDYKVVTTFDEKDNVLRKQYYFGKENKTGWRYEYDYYDNGSKKASRLYNGKNKLKELRTYDCQEMGMTEKQVKKDTSKVCIKYEYDKEGNHTKIIESIDEKGRLRTTKLTYDKKNNPLLAMTIDHKGALLYKYAWSYDDEGHVTVYEKQTRKHGRLKTTRYVYTRDNEGKVIALTGEVEGKEKLIVYNYTKF